MAEAEKEGPKVTIICAGPPYCSFKVVKARKIVKAGGCIWCTKIHTDQLGRVFIVQPGEA